VEKRRRGGEGGADADDVAEDKGDQQRRPQREGHLGEGVDDADVLEQGDIGDHARHEQDGGPGHAADERLVFLDVDEGQQEAGGEGDEADRHVEAQGAHQDRGDQRQGEDLLAVGTSVLHRPLPKRLHKGEPIKFCGPDTSETLVSGRQVGSGEGR
jgi:hypothetical protein